VVSECGSAYRGCTCGTATGGNLALRRLGKKKLRWSVFQILGFSSIRLLFRIFLPLKGSLIATAEKQKQLREARLAISFE
jgi:hypothetical protein